MWPPNKILSEEGPKELGKGWWRLKLRHYFENNSDMLKHALPCSLLILNSSSLTDSDPGRGTTANNVLGKFEGPFSFSTFCYCVALGLESTSIINLHSIPQTDKVKVANSYWRKRKKDSFNSSVPQWLAGWRILMQIRSSLFKIRRSRSWRRT